MYEYLMRLNQYIENAAKKLPDKIALITKDNSYNYADLNELANRFASFLWQQGVKRGDCVIVMTGNTVESVISFWGTLKVGAVISIISPDTPPEKLSYILEDSQAKMLIMIETSTHIASKVLSMSKLGLEMVLCMDNAACYVDNDAIFSFSQTLTTENDSQIRPTVLDIDLACIVYTSGSTGVPKGVMLTHRNMLAASNSINTYLKHESQDVIISALPMSFDYGLYQMIMAFSMGATLVLEPNFTWPMQILKKIEQYSVTVLPVVPSMVPLLEQHGKRFQYDLSTVRCITNTGAALNLKHITSLQRQFTQAEIYSMYGLTECKRCTYLPPEMLSQKAKSVGIAIPGTELWIVDDDGKPVSSNQIGQLVIRGATVMKGYLNLPEKTSQKLKDGLLPGEKVLYTGDLCWLDEAGYLYFHGRMDEVLKIKGIKVSPKEIEEVLVSHPTVSECAAIGIDNMELGMVIHLFVSISSEITARELRQYCNNQLTSEQQPQEIHILKSLPKTANGKFDKLSLKQIAEQQCKLEKQCEKILEQ